MDKFLNTPGDFKNLIAYKKAMCVYDGTIFLQDVF